MSPRQPPLTDAERSRAAADAVELVRAAVERPAGLWFAVDEQEE